ncbi:hypothetical protein AB0L40_24120 [Patulibacter sp. NPDC049589]|uniref:hypothetical protein n=1 Tax=Patulibacter sp. NPDC049589 TaxID=3154731 RepID=UPI003437895C
MARGRAQRGELTNYEAPNWEPLEAAVGPELLVWFMWMEEVRLRDGTAVHGYKHRATRRYLQLDEVLRAYWYDDGLYRRLPLWRAIDGVFASWRTLGASPGQLLLVDEASERAAARDEEAGGRTAA